MICRDRSLVAMWVAVSMAPLELAAFVEKHAHKLQKGLARKRSARPFILLDETHQHQLLDWSEIAVVRSKIALKILRCCRNPIPDRRTVRKEVHAVADSGVLLRQSLSGNGILPSQLPPAEPQVRALDQGVSNPLHWIGKTLRRRLLTGQANPPRRVQ